MEAPDESGCKLMDGFGIFIQLCLATTAFSTLIFKRQREQPQRPIRIWYIFKRINIFCRLCLTLLL